MSEKRHHINWWGNEEPIDLDPKCLYQDPANRILNMSGGIPYIMSYMGKTIHYVWLAPWLYKLSSRLAHVGKLSQLGNGTFEINIEGDFSEEDASLCVSKLKKLSSILPENPRVRYEFGSFLHFESKFPELAEEEYRKVLETNPKNLRARFRLGILLKNMLRFEEALNEFNEILRIDPNFEGAKYYSQIISEFINNGGKELLVAAMKGSGSMDNYKDLAYVMRFLHMYYLSTLFSYKWEELRQENKGSKASNGNGGESELIKKLSNLFKVPEFKEERSGFNYLLGEMYLERLLGDKACACFESISKNELDYLEVLKKIGALYMNSSSEYRAREIFERILELKNDEEFAKRELKIISAVEETRVEAERIRKKFLNGYASLEEKELWETLRNSPHIAFGETEDCKSVEQANQSNEHELEKYLENMKTELRSAEDYCELGEMYLKFGKNGKAIYAFRQAIELKPDSTRAYFGLARAAFKGNLSGGKDAMFKLLELDSKNVRKYLELLSRERIYPGDDVMLKVFEIDPEHVRDYVIMFSFDGYFVGGEEAMMRAMELDRSYIMEYLKMFAEHKHYPGDRILRKAIELNPFQEINFIKLFVESSNTFPGDRKFIEDAVTRGYKDAKLSYLYAKNFDVVNSKPVWFYEEKTGKAAFVPCILIYFRKSKEEEAKVYRYPVIDLTVPHPLEDIEKRTEHLIKAVSYAPDFFDAWLLLGKDLFDLMWYKGLDNQDEVIKAWKEALRLNPEHAEAHRYLAEVYWYTLRFDDALREFEEAERLEPQNIFNTLMYANFLQYIGRAKEAEDKYKKIYDFAHYYLGYLYHYLGSYEDAEIEYRKALVYKGFMWLDVIDIELLLGLLMFDSGRYEDALALIATKQLAEFRSDLKAEYALFISKLMEKLRSYEVAELMLYETEKRDPEYLKWAEDFVNFKPKRYDFMKLHPRVLSVCKEIGFRNRIPDFQEKLSFVQILDEAHKYLERIETNPDDALAHYGLALLCEKVGNLEGAERELKEVLRIKPDFYQASEKLEYLERRRKGELN